MAICILERCWKVDRCVFLRGVEQIFWNRDLTGLRNSRSFRLHNCVASNVCTSPRNVIIHPPHPTPNNCTASNVYTSPRNVIIHALNPPQTIAQHQMCIQVQGTLSSPHPPHHKHLRSIKCVYKSKERYHPPTQPTPNNCAASNVCTSWRNVIIPPPHPKQLRSIKCKKSPPPTITGQTKSMVFRKAARRPPTKNNIHENNEASWCLFSCKNSHRMEELVKNHPKSTWIKVSSSLISPSVLGLSVG